MSTPRRAILIMGLGRFLKNRPEFGSAEAVKQKVLADMEKTRNAGFECVNCDMNPEDPSETLHRLRDQLRSQPWDGVLIGFGVRGNVELTPLFEAAINLCVEETPRGKVRSSCLARVLIRFSRLLGGTSQKIHSVTLRR